MEKGYCCYSRTWLCNTSTAGSWNAPGTAACAPSHKHDSSFPEGSEASFLDLHGSITASIWWDLAGDKDEWKQTGKGENTPCASAPPSASSLSPDQSYSLIGVPTLKEEPHNNKQATGSQPSPSNRGALHTDCSLPGPSPPLHLLLIFPWALQSRK